MPQFDTGTSWDQGLSSLGAALFPDPSKIAQAGYYGAMQRNQRLEGDLKVRKMRGQDDYSTIINGMGNAPPQMQEQPQAVAAPPPGMVPPILGSAPGADPAQMASEAATQVINSFADAAPGGGVVMSTQAQQNGSPAPVPFDVSAGADALLRSDADQSQIQAGIGALVAKGLASGQLSKPRANQILLAFNPSEAGATMRQEFVTGQNLEDVWDNRTNTPTRIPHEQVVADGGRNYRGISEATGNAWAGPGRFYNPENPGASITAPMFVGANKGGVQVTQNGPAEATAGFIARGTPPTAREVETVTSAQTLSTPMPALDPEKQAQNRQIDDKVLQGLYPPTGNRTDANMPVVLDDPDQVIATRADELQRSTLSYRNNRAAATTQALQELQAAGRLGPANRGTSFIGRNAPGVVTGQVGANPDVVMVTVQTAKGPVKQPRLRVRVLPAGQRGQGGPAAPSPSRSAAPKAAPEQAAPEEVSHVFGLPQNKGPAKAYTGGFQPKNAQPFRLPQAAASNPSGPGGMFQGVPQGKSAGPFKGSAFTSTQPRPARTPPMKSTVQSNVSPAAQQPPAPQQQQPQGMQVNAPDGTMFKSKTTGQVMTVQGGMAYPATNDEIQVFQAGQR